MKNLQLTLAKDVLKKDFKWLDRDFKKGDQVYLFTGITYGCISKNGLACTLDDQLPFFELPAGLLSMEYENKQYTIFMTEEGQKYTELYAKEGPFNHMDLLTEIQNQKSTDIKLADQILKAQIIKSDVILSLISLQEIKPLF